ncbi:nudC domain-containing protein 1 [Poecilia reticulata]|uniref:nudC domain-containing protein 1 n=1 Tax=Poecilia reticulata TaxID=8081 RepID=UPI0007EB90E6|nr:PREDICTED: nudC domain-containing protein 1 [Poecilia reticulata]
MHLQAVLIHQYDQHCRFWFCLTGPVLCAAAVEELQLKDAHYTLEHLRAFGMFNHLQLDPWYQDSVLFVDSRGRVLSLSVTLDTALGKPKEVFSFGSESGRAEDRLCASISLTSATWAALSDGAGRLLLLRTGRRGDGGHCRWEVLFSHHMGEPFTILHSVCHVQDGRHSVELLLLRVQKEPLESTGSGYSVSLEWVTVGGAAGPGQERKYEVRKRRVLRGKSVPHYAAVAPRGEGLMLAAEKPFVFTHIDGRPVEPPPPPELSELEKTDPLYFWQQTAADLTVCVRLPGGVAKEDVSFRLTADSLSVGVRGGAPLLEGRLYASVDPEASAWTIRDSNSLEVSLQKLGEGPMWPELVLGNRRGELVLSDQQVALIHDRLTHLTSEDPVRSSAMFRKSSWRADVELGGRDEPLQQAVAMATVWQQPGSPVPSRTLVAQPFRCGRLELLQVQTVLMPISGPVRFMTRSGQIASFFLFVIPGMISAWACLSPPVLQVNLGGHQFLFSVDVDPSQMPCLCLRHDVDALVWQPRPDRPGDLWEHVATFNALGYVQASKRDRKFSTCAPDFSFAALCECLRRVFLYRQPSPVETVLFNRKQGRQVGQVAKQQVSSLDSDTAVLGFRASNERLFVLTSSRLFVLKVDKK